MELQNAFSQNSLMIIKALEDAKHEGYLVGGCVRDALLNVPSHDEDIVTSAAPEQIKEALRPLNPLFLDKGGEKYGTVVAIFNHVEMEITTFRTDGQYSDGRHPDSVQYAKTIQEDLGRRDFTINAMAWSPKTGLVDPYNGAKDLQVRQIKAVGDVGARLSEDPLRMLRAVRFANTLDFHLDEDTYHAIQNLSANITSVSKERVRDEILKMFSAPQQKQLELFYTTGLLKYICPAMDQCFKCEQNNEYHHTNVGQHCVDVVQAINQQQNITPLLRLAAFLHDVGKPDVHTVDELTGADHFIGHGEASARIAKQWMKEYHFSNAEINKVVPLVLAHDDANDISETKHKHRKMRNLLMKYQGQDIEFFQDLCKLKAADMTVHAKNVEERLEGLKCLHGMLQEHFQQGLPYNIEQIAVSGHDLMQEDINGKQITAVKNAMLRDVIDGVVPNTKDALMNRIKVYKLELKQAHQQER